MLTTGRASGHGPVGDRQQIRKRSPENFSTPVSRRPKLCGPGLTEEIFLELNRNNLIGFSNETDFESWSSLVSILSNGRWNRFLVEDASISRFFASFLKSIFCSKRGSWKERSLWLTVWLQIRSAHFRGCCWCGFDAFQKTSLAIESSCVTFYFTSSSFIVGEKKTEAGITCSWHERSFNWAEFGSVAMPTTTTTTTTMRADVWAQTWKKYWSVGGKRTLARAKRKTWLVPKNGGKLQQGYVGTAWLLTSLSC